MKMRLKDGKTKVLTLSYDDGVVQDIRLMEIMNKNGIKGTFNISTGRYLPEDAVREKYYGRMKRSETIELLKDSGHEVAVHCLTHPYLTQLDDTEILYEVMEDRRNIERDFGTITRGLAYPFSSYNDRVCAVLEKCGISYARDTRPTYGFEFPENWLKLRPTCHHNAENLMELAKEFAEKEHKWGNARMFYLWGHSYEFDDRDNWNVIEEFSEYIGGRDNIWYATNIEIYDYVMAYKNLQTSYDKKIIHNPSAIDVWAEIGGVTYKIGSGETLKL